MSQETPDFKQALTATFFTLLKKDTYSHREVVNLLVLTYIDGYSNCAGFLTELHEHAQEDPALARELYGENPTPEFIEQTMASCKAFEALLMDGMPKASKPKDEDRQG